MNELLNAEQLGALRQFDTCALCNAIETFQIRLNNEGFTNSTIRCLCESAPANGGVCGNRLRFGAPVPLLRGIPMLIGRIGGNMFKRSLLQGWPS